MWLIASFTSYFLNAIALVVDKALLKRSIPEPVTYAFYVSILSLFAFFLAPFGFYWPGFSLALIGVAAGLSSTFALVLLFYSLREGEASRVSPVIGGLVPIFIFFLAWFLLGEVLTFNQTLSFVMILVGSYLIVRGGISGKTMSKKLFFGMMASAFLFALSHTFAKYIYVEHTFSSGFIWRAIGTFLGAIFLILPTRNRRIIFNSFHAVSPKTGSVFIFGQIAAALAFLLLNYAFTLGPVSITNALSGVQHIFVFIFAILLARSYPQILEENLTPAMIFRKTISIILIGAGVFLLFLTG